MHHFHAALGKREKQRLAAQAAAADDKASLDATAAERDFIKLTELADLLLNAGGELDVYSHRKEQLEQWATTVLPQTNILGGETDRKWGAGTLEHHLQLCITAPTHDLSRHLLCSSRHLQDHHTCACRHTMTVGCGASPNIVADGVVNVSLCCHTLPQCLPHCCRRCSCG